jgi:zinc/manganese transport system substrate-binding protein
VLTVADLADFTTNPHFWYSPTVVGRVTDRIEADLKGIDPFDTSVFDVHRTEFDAASASYKARLTALKTFAGAPIASTESIIVYLANAIGLRVLSSPAFMNAVSEGNDPPAPDVAAFQDLLTKRQVRVLVYNVQTSTVVTTNLLNQAKSLGIAIVPVSETIQPAGETYEAWFDAELTLLQQAL